MTYLHCQLVVPKENGAQPPKWGAKMKSGGAKKFFRRFAPEFVLHHFKIPSYAPEIHRPIFKILSLTHSAVHLH